MYIHIEKIELGGYIYNWSGFFGFFFIYIYIFYLFFRWDFLFFWGEGGGN